MWDKDAGKLRIMLCDACPCGIKVQNWPEHQNLHSAALPCFHVLPAGQVMNEVVGGMSTGVTGHHHHTHGTHGTDRVL